MKLKDIPLTQLSISKLNMRAKDKEPDISDILPSIRRHGVHQTLLVRPEGDSYGILAGRRRFHALLKVAEETGEKLTAPCGVLETDEDAVAIEASLIENLARLPATELEQFAAFKKLKTKGRSVSDIADYFGVTELKVKRILALASLKPAILKIYERDEINVPTIRLLTMASSTQQAEWLKLAGDEAQETPTGHWLKTWLVGEQKITTDAALFDVKDYKGAILTDLFGETGYFADPDLFWELQNAKISDMVSAYQAEGWTMELLERGQRFHDWNYVKRAKEAGGKVFISVGTDGHVKAHEGYLTAEDAKKIQAILTGAEANSDKAKPTVRPEMSGPLVEYVNLHRHSAIRATLLARPDMSLRLSVAHMLVGSALWSVAPQKTRARKDATTESVAASQGAIAFEKEREVIYQLLDITQFDCPYSPHKRLAEGDIVELFAKLLTMDDATVMRILTFAMAESLEAGSDIVEATAQTIDMEMAFLWEPDDAFFDILRDKKVINAMMGEIAGERTAKAHLTDTGAKQKQIIRNRIAGHGCEPDRAWRPRWMQTMPRHYLDIETTPPAGAAKRVKAKLTKLLSKPAKKKAA